jgi:hypothetical protein
MVLQWTAASVTLTADMEDVLLFDAVEGEFIGYYYETDGKFIRYSDGKDLHNVTHWMPLPEKPTAYEHLVRIPEPD